MNRFKENLRELRLAAGLTQRQLAGALHVLERTVSYWEQGRQECDFDMLLAIARFFDVTTDELLTDYPCGLSG